MDESFLDCVRQHRRWAAAFAMKQDISEVTTSVRAMISHIHARAIAPRYDYGDAYKGLVELGALIWQTADEMAAKHLDSLAQDEDTKGDDGMTSLDKESIA